MFAEQSPPDSPDTEADLAARGYPGDVRLSAELYDLLCMSVKGEALAIVRGCNDMLGFVAWRKLHQKYAPRTMARAIRMVAAVTSPPVIRTMEDVETKVTAWEGSMDALTKNFREKFGPTVKIGILTNMLPPQLQDVVYTMVDGKTSYEEIAAKVRSIASNNVAMTAAVPMDVNAAAYDEDDDVDAVGSHTQCFRCQGWGHTSRDCPSKGKGKSKGSFGKGAPFNQFSGKSKGKGFDNAKGGKSGKGGKGKGGVTINGPCYECGVWGHRGSDCRAANVAANAVHEEGVWLIGAVDCATSTSSLRTSNPSCTSAGQRSSSTPISTCNRYSALEEAYISSSISSAQGASSYNINMVLKSEPHGQNEKTPKRKADKWGGIPNDNSNDSHGHKKNPKINIKDAQCGKGHCFDCLPKDFVSKRTKRHTDIGLGFPMNGSGGILSDDIGMDDFSHPSYGTDKAGDKFIDVCAVSSSMTRESCMKFHVAGVKKPLASAAKVVKANNRIFMDASGGYIENITTGEKMNIRILNDVFVVDVIYPSGEKGVITLDSGAGCNVWPRDLLPQVPMTAKDPSVRMTAANGTVIENVGQKLIQFAGFVRQGA
jgi:hypothetical protein